MSQKLFKINLPHIPSELAQKLGIHIQIVGWYRFEYENPEYYSEGIPGFDLIYSVSGKGWIYNGSEKIEVFPKTLTILDTNSRFGSGALPSNTWEFLYVHFEWKHFDNVFKILARNGHTFQPIIPDVIENDFREIFRLKESEDISFEFIAAQKVMNALGEMYTKCFSGSKKLSCDRITDSVINCIKENYMLPLSTEELSGLAGYSSDYLCRVFKKYTNYTVNEYIVKCRLEASKKLLLNSNLSIKEVADRAGFNSQAYFSRIFKQKNGVTPLEYKNGYVL